MRKSMKTRGTDACSRHVRKNTEDMPAGTCFDGGKNPPQQRRCSAAAVQPAVGSTTSGLIVTEVNGFVSWIASFAFSLCFLVWAVVPHEYLHRLSISYLLNTYWALAVPAIVIIGLVTTFLMYNALNLLNVRSLDDLCLVSDEQAPPSCPDHAEELDAAVTLASAVGNSDASWWMYEFPLPRKDISFSRIQDMPLSVVNKIMFRAPAVVQEDDRFSPHSPDQRLL